MMSFNHQLADVIEQRKKSKSKAKKKELDERLEAILTKELTTTQDFASFLSSVEQGFSKYHLPAKAIVSSYSELSEQSRVVLLDSLKTNTNKSLIYQVIGRLLTETAEDEGFDLFQFCCENVTDQGSKVPAKSIQRMVGTALFLVPGLKEKPFKKILDRELSASMVLCLVPLLFQIGEDGRNKKYPLLADKLILKAVQVWTHLDFEKRKAYARCLKPFFQGKRPSEIVFGEATLTRIPSAFMEAVHASQSVPIAGLDSTPPAGTKPIKETEGVPQDIPEQAPGPFRTVSQMETGEPSGPRLFATPDQIDASFDPIAEIQRLLKWVQQTQRLNRTKEEVNRQLEEENQRLKNEAETLQKEKNTLSTGIQELRSAIQRQGGEIESISLKLETQEREHRQRIEKIVEESDKREKRKLEEMKNRIASDIQPLVDEICDLSREQDGESKSRKLTKLINTVVNLLKHAHSINLK